MYTWTRVARFKNVSSMMIGMPICVSIVEHLKTVLNQDASLMAPILGGHPARVLFVIRSDDLNKNMDGFDRANQDAKYRELLGKLSEHVDGAATHAQVWKKVV